jgi:fructokinase
MTIGTGIGGGAMVNGHVAHGLIHPEMGHILLARDPVDREFVSVCPYHTDCLEGLAAGPALARRWGVPGKDLPEDHRAWDLEAHYLAAGVVNIMVTLSPKRIILGGGVMESRFLFPKVRREFTRLLNGYLRHRSVLTGEVDELIVPPALGGRAGVLGAIVLAENVVKGNA